MEVKTCKKPAFTVVGKEGSTAQGPRFIQALWAEANAHFEEVAHLAKRDKDGAFCGFWGAMTDTSRSFQPWTDNFSTGLYLAGVECTDGAEAPGGWTKWVVPAFEFCYTAQEDGNTFAAMLAYLKEQGLTLAGAVQDFTCPKTGQGYVYFPVK